MSITTPLEMGDPPVSNCSCSVKHRHCCNSVHQISRPDWNNFLQQVLLTLRLALRQHLQWETLSSLTTRGCTPQEISNVVGSSSRILVLIKVLTTSSSTHFNRVTYNGRPSWLLAVGTPQEANIVVRLSIWAADRIKVPWTTTSCRQVLSWANHNN